MFTMVVIGEGYRCVGSSTTAFDDHRLCVVDDLPWTSWADFDNANVIAEHLHEEEFYRHVSPDPFVEPELDGHECDFLQSDGVFYIYDRDTSVYYFFA